MWNFQFRIWFSPLIILTIWAKNVKLWLVRKDDFVPKRIIFINIGFCKSQSFLWFTALIYGFFRGTLPWKSLFRKILRHNFGWTSLSNISATILASWGADVVGFFLIREWYLSPLFQSILLVDLIELCLQMFPRSLTFLWYNVLWTYFCSQFRQSRYMIYCPHVIGILFLFHIFVSDFLVFILNTIVYTFTLLLLKRYPSIKWTYQYFHLAMMFTFGAKEDEKLSFYHSVEYFCEILIMSVSNKCIITPVYIIFFLFNFFHSQFVQFGHLVEFFNCCLPYIIESFSNFTDVILTLSCHYRCQVVLTN